MKSLYKLIISNLPEMKSIFHSSLAAYLGPCVQ